MYKGDADWTLIGEVKNNPRMVIPVFGNGDIDTPEKALEYKNRYGVDGIMIGRASIGYPWVFREMKHYFRTGQHLDPPTIQERAEVARRHLEKSIEWKGVKLGVAEMRRHYTNYFRDLPGIKPFRQRLVTETDPAILHETIDEIIAAYKAYPALIPVHA